MPARSNQVFLRIWSDLGVGESDQATIVLNRLVGVECRQRLRMAEQVRFLEQTERAVGINPAMQISLRPNRRQILWGTSFGSSQCGAPVCVAQCSFLGARRASIKTRWLKNHPQPTRPAQLLGATLSAATGKSCKRAPREALHKLGSAGVPGSEFLCRE